MKTTIRLLLLLAFLAAMFGQPAGAGAGGGAGSGHFKDLGADAYFVSTDPSGCIVTTVLVFATHHYFQSPPGRGIREPFVSLDVLQDNVCTGEQLVQAGGGTTTNIDLQVDKKMNWTTLRAVVPVFEGVSQTFTEMYVDLAWTAVGPRTNQNWHDHFNSPGCRIMYHSSGVFRIAEVSGSISDGGTNYTPEPARASNIFNTRSGTTIAGCL